ncbi:MAG: peptidyl-prolyl cis-trans isomerase [bacterium]|nr:peptidyl-prolyl cis-trans isomerase [bacterium]
MPSLMRKNVRSFLVKAIISIIVLAFIGTIFLVWGVGGERAKEKGRAIATIFGEDITHLEYATEYRQLYEYYQNQFKDHWSPEMAERMQLKKMALDNVINRRLLTHEAIKQGIVVDEKEVLAKIQSMPIFQQNGRFDSQVYAQVLEYGMHMDPATFEDQIKKSLLIDRLREKVRGGIKVSQAELLDAYTQQNEKVEADYVLFTPATFIPQVTVSDDEVRSYFEKNKQKYQLPRQRKIRYIYVACQQVKNSLTVDEESIKKYYETHETQYQLPKQVRARHILIKTDPAADVAKKEEAKKQAEALLQRIKAGEDFAKLAGEFSQDPGSASQGGDLGYFGQGRMTPAFEKAAFALPKGGLSEVVESPFGYHIIKVEDIQEARTKPIEEVREQIKSQLLDEKAWEAAENEAYALVRSFYKAGRLEDVAVKAGYAIGDTEFAEDAKLVPGIGPYEEVVKSAFSLKKDDVSMPIRAGAGFYILRLVDEIPARVPELDKVKDKVVMDLKKEKSEAKAKEVAEELRGRLKSAPADLASVAGSYQLTVSNTGEVSHNGFIKGLGQNEELSNALFSLREGEVTPVIQTSRGYCLAVLKKRIGVDLKKFAEEEPRLREQALRTKEYQMFQTWLERLKKENNIVVDYNQV